jgi:hypothetical protein
MVVKSGNALRRNWWCAGRPLEELPHGHNVALHRTLSPSRTCGGVQAGGHCCPRGVAPRPRHAVMEDNPVVAHGRSNGPSASPCHGIRTLKFISQGLAVVEGVAASSCRTLQGGSAAGDRKARSTLGLWRRPGRHAARVRTRQVPTRYAPIFSNRLTKSSACSSSTARMVSIKRRVVGSSLPKYWIISR